MKTLHWIAAAAVACSAAIATSASAASLLYRNDFVLGTDYLGQAIGDSAYTVTQTSGDLSGFTLGDYDVVVYANQDSSMPAGDAAALNAYVAGGGHVIYDDWTHNPDFLGGEAYTFNDNLTTLTLGPLFGSGISGPLTLTNPGWGTFSTGMTGVTVAGTFENGDAAIVVGNGGHTIVNGFLSDTVESKQLYINELASFTGGGAVPEPAAWGLMILGFAGVGAMVRRRSAVAA